MRDEYDGEPELAEPASESPERAEPGSKGDDLEGEDFEDDDFEDSSDEERVAVEFVLGEDDVVQFTKERLRDTVRLGRILGGVGAFFTLVAVASNWPVRPGVWLGFLTCSLALAGGTRLFYLEGARRALARIHPDQRAMRVTIDGEALLFEGEGWSSALLWTCLDGWAEWPSAISLTLGSELRVLPKRVLTERDVHVLTQLAQRHVQAPAPAPEKRSSGAKTVAWIFVIGALAAIYHLLRS